MCFMLPVNYTGLRAGCTKKEATVFSQSTLTEIVTLKNKLGCSSLILLNLIKNGILHFFFAMLALVHDALRRRQLQISFRVRRSKEHHETSIYINFYFSNPKLSQERRFFLSVSCINLCVQSTMQKKQLIASFEEQFKGKS